MAGGRLHGRGGPGSTDALYIGAAAGPIGEQIWPGVLRACGTGVTTCHSRAWHPGQDDSSSSRRVTGCHVGHRRSGGCRAPRWDSPPQGPGVSGTLCLFSGTVVFVGRDRLQGMRAGRGDEPRSSRILARAPRSPWRSEGGGSLRLIPSEFRWGGGTWNGMCCSLRARATGSRGGPQ
jgi:hypothetical protein